MLALGAVAACLFGPVPVGAGADPTGDAGARSAPHEEPWSFGVMGDTQWTEADDGRNPGTCAVDIINQVNEQFIKHGVKFVIAVGDLTDASSASNVDIRAVYAQALYSAGIGFFPLRGNHDSTDMAEFKRVFPQTRGGPNNATPADALAVANPDAAAVPPVPVRGAPFVVGTNFSSPEGMAGLSYSFDYKNVRFVLLDQFDGRTNTIQPQQSWISEALAGRLRDGHAIVFGHKGLMTEYHSDNLFGPHQDSDPAGTDAFIQSLAANGVRYYVGGHDHMHDLSLVWTHDGVTARVTELVCASDSSKFYLPRRHGWRRWVPGFLIPVLERSRQAPIAQETRTVGYYIFNVDGPRMTVDYYSAPVALSLIDGEWTLTTTPSLMFSRRQTFGYDLRGKEFVVPQGSSYGTVDDAFEGTRARIIDGTSLSDAKDGTGRPFIHAVNTGWSKRSCGTASQELHLWGMATTLGSAKTDTYTLAIAYDDAMAGPVDEAKVVGFGLVTKVDDGRWTNAVDSNAGGTKAFVWGPWRAGYGLGTYGVDARTRSAWAVINHGEDFRVGYFDERRTDEAMRAPTLVIRGNHDLIADPGLATKLTRATHVLEVVIPRATYWAPYEAHRAQVLEETASFLKDS